MKKIGVICMVLFFAASNVLAQELQEKTERTRRKAEKDFSHLFPQKGNFALGLDMAQFTQSILSGITKATDYEPVWAFQSDFHGKYFLTNTSALRLRLGIGINNFTEREFVTDDAANLLNPLPHSPILEAKTVDVWKNRNTGIELGIGYEFRRTLWRVQGYVGAEVFGGILLNRDFFEYGNPMTATNQTPTIAYGNGLGTGSYRLLDSKGFGFTTGASLIIGADWFVCRNFSIGAEFSLQGRYNRWNEVTGKTETWLFDQAYTAAEKIKPVDSSFGINPNWGLNLMIYF